MQGTVFQNKQLNVVIAALMAVVVALSLTTPATAYAASLEAGSIEPAQTQGVVKTTAAKVATKAVKPYNFTCDTATIKKVATKVGKGTTRLNFKSKKTKTGNTGSIGYVRFVAPATKKYAFNFSGLSSKQMLYTAHFQVQTPDSRSPKYSWMTKVNTKGGQSSTLQLATKNYKGNSGTLVNRPLQSRTATVTLKKGQEIYFDFFAPAPSASVTLKIK